MIARFLAATAAAALVALSSLMPGTAPAQALSVSPEHIASYDIELDIREDGRLGVRETIDYAFPPGEERHGIFRTIPVKTPFDSDNDRVYRIDGVSVSSPTGAPADVERSESGGYAHLRIGDPDTTVDGRHTYVIDYVVTGALNAFGDHDELYWNAIGTEWSAPILASRITVTAPADIERTACFAGPAGSGLACAETVADGRRVEFAQTGPLDPYEAFTVVVGLPKGAVSTTGPLLEERWTLRRTLTPTALTGTLAGLVLVPGLFLVGLAVLRRGRDRRYAGLVPGLLPATGSTAAEEAVPLVGNPPTTVAFQPPDGLRPGQVGTLLDERVSPVDITATIVDLAVRGHIRIEEQPRSGFFSKRDWQLVRLPPPTGDHLMPYEKTLIDGLFRSRESVGVSTLKGTFGAELRKVHSALYDDVTAAGFFRRRPDKERSYWTMAGTGLAFGGTGLAFALSEHLHWPPVAIAAALVGGALLLAARWMPARTARGSAVLAQARGFREYIRVAEAEQLRFEEREQVFSRYLPYAVVFGEADRWVKAFGPVAAASSASWYVGPHGWSSDSFGDSLSGFSSSASGSLAAATASSSGGSGFSGGSSGGGGGGGGGGSW